jgi:hypothetical protein
LKSADRDPSRTKLLGLGLDGTDGHTRLTRGDDFMLCGGSEETHSKMQETTIKLNEKLRKSGRRIGDVPPRELGDILRESLE